MTDKTGLTQSIKNKKRTYCCPKCPKSFGGKANLNQHAFTHYKREQCKQCGKWLKYTSYKAHLRSNRCMEHGHKRNTRKIPYQLNTDNNLSQKDRKLEIEISPLSDLNAIKEISVVVEKQMDQRLQMENKNMPGTTGFVIVFYHDLLETDIKIVNGNIISEHSDGKIEYMKGLDMQAKQQKQVKNTIESTNKRKLSLRGKWCDCLICRNAETYQKNKEIKKKMSQYGRCFVKSCVKVKLGNA